MASSGSSLTPVPFRPRPSLPAGPRPLTPAAMRQVAMALVEQSHGDPAIAGGILRDVQDGQPAATRDGLGRALAQALADNGYLDKPPAGDPPRQQAAIKGFRSILARPPALTADQLRRILPGAGAEADVYAPLLTQAMAVNGITTPAQRAAFLAQLGPESHNLHQTEENLNYSTPRRLSAVFHSRIRSPKAATPYIHHPEALANHVYAGKNGNGNEASGDGWLFRGRGLIQVTGRSNYGAIGYEGHPDDVAAPADAAMSAALFWRAHGLAALSRTELDYSAFYTLVGHVNAAHLDMDGRWAAYQRGLDTLGGRTARR